MARIRANIIIQRKEAIIISEEEVVFDNQEQENKKILELTKSLVTQNEAIQKIKHHLESLEKDYNALESDLIDCMLSLNLQAIQNEYGKFPIKESIHASVNKPKESRLFAWLRRNGDGGLIKEAVHHLSLSGLIGREIKEFMEERKSTKLIAQFVEEVKEKEHGIGELPLFINVFVKQKIKMPKVKDLECSLMIQ